MFLGSRARPALTAISFTAICEPTVYTMLDPQHLTTIQASTACYGDSFTFYLTKFQLCLFIICRLNVPFIRLGVPDTSVFLFTSWLQNFCQFPSY
jgi:hypothetical protein